MTEPWASGPVVVTGGTGHVGIALARAFLDAGARTVVVGSTRAGAEAACARLGHPGALAEGADLTRPEQIAALFERVADAAGAPAVLVNCAGVNHHRAIAAVTPDEFDRVVAINVKAAFFAAREACARMVAAGIAGRVVNVTSGNYRYVRPDAALYSATKAALEMLTRGFALDYGRHGIAVNAVAPGLVAREGLEDAGYLRVADYYRAHSTQQRLVQPQDVAAAVLFLASEKAAAIGGETLVVDGGFSAARMDFPRRPS